MLISRCLFPPVLSYGVVLWKVFQTCISLCFQHLQPSAYSTDISKILQLPSKQSRWICKFVLGELSL